MIPHSASVIYFSPTDTTRKIAYTIAASLHLPEITYIDLTNPHTRQTDFSILSDIVIFGAPVYEEYIPGFIIECLRRMHFNSQPTLAFSVYGNIGYGLSLRQLYDELRDKGLSVISLGAFVGEHSFSTEDVPLARGRPNDGDLENVKRFAEQFLARLTTSHSPIEMNTIPGTLPLMTRILPKGSAKLFTKPPVVNSNCNSCRVCLLKCPMGAIDDHLHIDEAKCIRCFSCVKHCARAARKIEYKKKFLVKMVLHKNDRHQKKAFMM